MTCNSIESHNSGPWSQATAQFSYHVVIHDDAVFADDDAHVVELEAPTVA